MNKKTLKTVIFSCLITFFSVAAIWAATGIVPFGNKTVITGDLAGLYMPFASYVKREIAGGFSHYSFQKALGGGVAGLVAYIPVAPYMLLVSLFSVAGLSEFFSYILALKLIAASGTFSFFTHKKYNSGIASIISGVCYALMGYSLIYAQNTMWLDNVVILPIILHSLERIVQGKKSAPFIISLAYAILCNYYTAFMICVFSVIYYFWYSFGEKRIPFKPTIKNFFRFGLGGVVAAGLTGVFTLPMVFQTLGSKGFSSNSGPLLAFPLKNFGRQFVLFTFSHDQLEAGAPIIYCGTFALLAAVFYFASKRIGKREKTFSALIILIFIMSFFFTKLNRFWHIFRDPVWFPFRYSFLFCAFLLIIAAKGIKNAPKKRGLIRCLLIFLILFSAVLATQAGILSFKKLLVTLGTGVILSVILLLGRRLKRSRIVSAMLVAVVAIELSANGAYIMKQFELRDKLNVKSYLSNIENLINKTDEDGFFRIEKDSVFSLNDPMLLGYNGLNHFSSVVDTQSNEVLKDLGFSGIYKNPTFSNPASNSLIGIKYLITDGKYKTDAVYDFIGESAENKMYKNPFVLPFAFFAEDISFETKDNPFEAVNEIYSAILGYKVSLFEKLNYSRVGETFEIDKKFDTACYVDFISETDGSIIKVNGETFGTAGVYSERGTAPLGILNEDMTVEISGYDFEFWGLDLKLMEECFKEISKNVPKKIEVNKGIIILSGDAKGSYLVLSMPFYEDWLISKGGDKSKLIPAFDNLTAVEMPFSDKSNLELRYLPKGMNLGKIVTFASILILLFILMMEKKKITKNE
ncbi:MAG: YfhO family protein [Ruminococcaceae bacterium]|nr:YfhO family protein [Oscillospiraceae bacterium]